MRTIPSPQFPPDVTEQTGLTSWPDRGSMLAADFEVTWQHARRRVEIRYETGDALWAVTEYNGSQQVSADLLARAQAAYEAALSILVSPLPMEARDDQ
jgi:hypothetical protein